LKKLILIAFAAVMLLVSNNVFAQAPTLSYTPSTNVYPVGTAITQLSATSSGVATYSGYTAAGTVALTAPPSGAGPKGLGIDKSGNIYSANFTTNTISKYTAGAGSPANFTSGTAPNKPNGIAFDAAGNAYVVNSATAGTGTVAKYNSSGVFQSAIITGLTHPLGIWIDAFNNIYVTDYNGTTQSSFVIKKYAITGGAAVLTISSTTAAQIGQPDNVTVDPAGNIFSLNSSLGTVTEFSPTGAFIVRFATGYSTASPALAITSDHTGRIYVGASGNNKIFVYAPATGVAGTTLATVASTPQTDPEGVVIDGKGNMFTASFANNTIYKRVPNGGYFIDKDLPAGLVFNNTTGAITGTPTVATTATNYTVTAWNATGTSVSATISITTTLFAPAITYTPSTQVYLINQAISTYSPVNTGGFIASYSISIPLPTGLSFNTATGDITGTPTITNPATNYTVTATNATGTSPTVINIATVLLAPAITYTPSTQVYPLNLTIATYSPVNTGGPVASLNKGYGAATLVTGGTLSSPFGIGSDAAGNIYVVNSVNNTISKYNSSGVAAGLLTTTGATLANPVGVVFDSQGNYYILNENTTASKVYKYNAAGALQSVSFIANLTTSFGIAIDASDNLYVTGYSGTTYFVSKYTTTGATGTLTLSLGTSKLNKPTGVAVDPSGNIYVLMNGNGQIYKFPTAGGNGTRYPNATATFGTSYGIAADRGGNIYIANSTGGTVTVYNSTTLLTTITGLTTPRGMVVDNLGNLYVDDFTHSTLKKFAPVGGYFISPTLPKGLLFNALTGNITGKPTAASPATDYTITASNATSANSTIVNITCVLAAPILNYAASPFSGKVGTTIPAGTITLTNTGSPVSASVSYQTPGTLLANGASVINKPYAMAFDAAGNIYIANSGANNILEYTSAGVYSSVFIASVVNPTGIVFDSAGNCYVLSEGTISNVYKYNSTGGAVTTFIPNLNTAFGMAIDAADNLYVTNYLTTTYSVKKYTNGVATLTLGTTNLNKPTGITVDPAGNIYVLNGAGKTVTKFPPAGGNGTASFISGLSATTPYAITSDGAGNIYIGDSNNNAIKIYSQSGGATAIATITLTDPRGLAVDGQGNLYGASFSGNSVTKYTPANGYFVNNLPAGLILDSTTGEISGTPTASTPATDYTVTGWNAAGPGSTNVNITCYQQYTWVGSVTGGLWNDSSNWGGTLPTSADQIVIGAATFTNGMVINAATGPMTVSSILMNTSGGKAPSITVTGTTLKVTGDITYASSNTTTTITSYNATISGNGAITANNLNVIVNSGTRAYNETLTSSINTLTLSGDLVLTSSFPNSRVQDATFNLTSGIMTVRNMKTLNTDATNTSTIAVSSGTTVLFIGADALSGLSANGNTLLTGLNTATIGYTGNNDQVVYTDDVIPNSTSLASGISYTNLIIGGTTGIKTATGDASNFLNISGDFTNLLTSNATDTYLDVSEPTVNLNGGNQALKGGDGAGTQFSDTNISGVGTKNMSTGKFSIASSGVLTMTGASSTILNTNAGVLTLNSDADGTATIAALNGPVVNGTVYAQRFITGGGDITNRGYRLLSSTVSDAVATGFYSLSYFLGSGTYISGATGSGGGFDVGGNPTIYLFREDKVPSNAVLQGNNRPVTQINNTPAYSISTGDGDFNLPVGNGFLFFFRGNRGTISTTPPNDVTVSALGHVNQGSITVNDWYNPGADTLGISSISGAASTTGFNLVGNPYPSAIDWHKIYGNNTTGTGICCAANLDNSIYIYNASTKNYSVYTNTGPSAGQATGSPGGSNIIPQGQGFYVRVTRLTGPGKLVFNESAKVNDQPDTLLLNSATEQIDKHLRFQLYKDSINRDETVVVFNKAAGTAYAQQQDALYLKGSGAVSLSAMSSDNRALALYQLPFPQKTQIIPLKVAVTSSGRYKLNMTEATNLPDLFDVWLLDNYNRDSLDLKHNPVYNFIVNTGDTATYGANRFKVVIRINSTKAVHLLNFTATKGTSTVKLSWTAENEGGYTTYVLQRSTDGGKTFAVLDSLTSVNLGTYNDIDPHPATGTNLYRLKQIDVAGNITFSSVISITYQSLTLKPDDNAIVVYPNPVRSVLGLVIKPADSKPANYKITITNNMGIIVKTTTTNLQLWFNDVVNLLPGTYFVNVVNTRNNSLIGKSTFIKL
jgi:sugar lactone lactonase YvrE